MSTHDIAAVRGWLGRALSAAFALPQALRLLRIDDTRGIALPPGQALIASRVAWAVCVADLARVEPGASTGNETTATAR